MPNHLPRFRTSVIAALGVALAAHAAPTPATAGPVSTTARQRTDAASAAVAKVGSPYKWGATGPRAFDCSGLVGFAYRVARRPLPGRTTHELARTGARVSRRGLKRGDLVFTWDRALGHVGIYLGAGRYVHAPGTGRRVQIAPLPAGRGLVRAVRP